MHFLARLTRLFALLCVTAAANGAALPYDAGADAHADVRDALRAAAQQHRAVLLVFGANWCEDCRALDKALMSSRNAALMAREFTVVKVDVGDFDRNLDIDAAYGDPIAKGIPAAVIVSPANTVLFATRTGELADARRMSETGIHDFFVRAAAAAKAAH
ncbi:MAG TPA: thioredoxin family protein [Casimicrobiaceae bacterium]